MKVFFVTNMLPVPDYRYFGIHVKEQIDCLVSSDKVNGEVHFINGRQSKLNYLKSIGGIKKAIRSSKPDLIHIHYGLSGFFTLFFTPKVPVVLTLHSGEIYQKKSRINHLLQKWVTEQVIKKASKVIILNDDMGTLLSAYAPKLIKIPCGTDVTEFTPEEGLRGKLDTFIIGFPANKNRPEKNFVLFQKIIDLLRKKHKIQVVEFNNMTRPEVIKFLNAVDVLCMTSTIEGSPQIIKEAMACNVPVVSSAVGDVQDLLEDVSNSAVIKGFDEQKFADAISKILMLPADERVSNGRAKLNQMRLSSAAVTDRLVTLYHSVLNEAPVAHPVSDNAYVQATARIITS